VSLPPDLSELALAVLAAGDPRAKAAASLEGARIWALGGGALNHRPMQDRPARPERPELCHPSAMPRRRALTTHAGRIALLHALAHIEFNAIDLAWDIAARFPGMPGAFYDDWLSVGADEARHFLMLSERLAELGAAYGDLPAHDGLWQAAMDTSDDLLARLAVVPLVLEARGLDVTPGMIERLNRAGDSASAAILEVIYAEEVGHVATGMRWYRHVCAERGLEPEATWKVIVAERFRGRVKPPFNEEARDRAGLPAAYYAGETL
jgi:uncharacterized ferritin-like protein (DUF455 family)